MKLAPAELLEGFAASPMGSRIWVAGLGRSMAPLLRSGDALEIERCTPEELCAGDIVLLRRGAAAIAHVVQRVNPLRTSSFRGVADATDTEPLGRATKLRIRGRVVRITGRAKTVLRTSSLLLRFASRSKLLRATVRRVRAAAFGPSTSRLRAAWLGEITVRRLRAEDLGETLRFCGDHLPITATFLERQLTDRWENAEHAFGAFDRRQRMVAFAYVDEYRQEGLVLPGEWLRFNFVAPHARNLGIGERLIDARINAVRSRGGEQVAADIRMENEASRRLLQRFGFFRDEALTRAVNEARSAGREAYEALVLRLSTPTGRDRRVRGQVG